MKSTFYPRPILLGALITTLTHGVAVAQGTLLPDITINATQLTDSETLNNTTLDKQALRAMLPSTSDTSKLLQKVPGVNLQGAGGVSSLPVIHGLADDRLRIKVDGMDLISACGNHMNPALSYIDPTNVGSASVFTGIAPVSSGGDSIGGSILVDSAPPLFASSADEILKTGEVGTFYRSNGNALGANIGATIASDTLSLSYRASTVSADNYKAGDDFKPAGAAAAGRGVLDGDEVGSSMYKSTNQSILIGLRQENHLFDLKLGVQDIPYQGWPNQRMDMTGNDSTQTNLHYLGDYDWGMLDARAYHENTRHVMQFYDDKLFWYGPNGVTPSQDGLPCTPSGGTTGCAAGMPMDTEGDNTGITVKAEIDLSLRDLLRVGAEVRQYRLDDWWDASGKGMWPDTLWNIKNGERDRLAVFGEWEAKWDAQWQTQLGLRTEKVEMDTDDVQGYNTTYAAEAAAFNAAEHARSDSNIDLTALSRYKMEDTSSLEFGYARKTRSPSLYERYTWSTGGMAMRMINWAGDGNGYVGNLDLEPEISHTLSATFDWHDAARREWSLQLTPYYTYIDDYIDVQRCSSANTNCGAANQTVTDAFVYLQFVNQSATLYGLDISGELELAQNTRFGSFRATGLVNYLRGENDDTADNLYNMMPLNSKLALVQRLSSWTNTLEVELVDNKSNVSQVRNELETAGYGLLHLRSSYEWKQLRVDVGVENLLDRFYNDPLGGAYTGQGKTMSGTDVPWGVAVPGMGRSIYAGLTLEF